MLVQDLRTKSHDELKSLVEELKAELFMLRFKNSTGQLEQPHKINLVKKDIAKVFTVLNDKNPAPVAAPKKATAKKATKAKTVKKDTVAAAEAKADAPIKAKLAKDEAAVDAKDESGAAKAWDKEELETVAKAKIKEVNSEIEAKAEVKEGK